MMDDLTFRAFEPIDLVGFRLQPGQSDERALLDLPFPEEFIRADLSLTAARGPVVLGCAGVVPANAHRAIAWAYVSTDVRPRDWTAITRRTIAVLDQARAAGFRRIEATARFDYPSASRWLRMLGFICETPVPMPYYGPEGDAYYQFARIRP